MATPAAQNDEIIQLILDIDAQAATASLSDLQAQAERISKTIQKLSAESGASFGLVANRIKEVSASLVQSGEAVEGVKPKVLSEGLKMANIEAKNMKGNLDAAARSGSTFNNILRLIRGTLVAIGVFRVISFIDDSLRKAAEAAAELETSLYRLVNVERILSQGGVNTSLKGLQNVIDDIKKELPIFSRADITQQVSLIGIMTKELGLTEDKIGDVAKAIGVLNIRSGEMEDLLTTTNKVLTALVAPSGRGIASLGLDFGEANLEATAFANGVLKAGESFSDLTKHEKDMLKIAILLESTGQELSTVQDFLKTNTGALAEQNAEWEDTLANVGQLTQGIKASLAPATVELLKGLQDGINFAKTLMVLFEAIKNEVMLLAVTLAHAFQHPLDFIKNYDKYVGQLSDVFVNSLREGFDRLFSGQIPSNAPEWFKRIFGSFADNAGEATNEAGKFKKAIEDIGQLKGFNDLINDISRLQKKMQDLNEEFAIKQTRAAEDYTLKVKRLNEDYANDVERTMISFNNRRTDIENRYRLNELAAEENFQEDLRQLRESYLFNLEDALRERDARQVLRLQRQYQMNKENLTKEFEIEQAQRARAYKEELAQLERQRAERLRILEEEHQLKLQRAEEDFQIEQARAQQDHERQLEDLKNQINDRLMEFARQIGEEYNLRQEGVNQIYELLQEYYGPGGQFDDLYNYSVESAAAAAQAILDAINAAAQAASYLTTSLPSILQGIDPYYGQPNNVGPQAQGGIFAASKPTTATFGEAGPELAAFIPLNKIGSLSMGVAGGNNDVSGGIGGKLRLVVDLSPDLEARVVDSSLDKVSTVINRVRSER